MPKVLTRADRQFSTVRVTALFYAFYLGVMFPAYVLDDPGDATFVERALVVIFSWLLALGAYSAVRRRRLGYHCCRIVSFLILPGLPMGTVLGWNMLRALRRTRQEFFSTGASNH